MSANVGVGIVPLVLSLGLDTFALSATLGVAPLPRTRVRLALTFAAAEGLMPAVGLLIGRPLGEAIGQWASYAAAALLIVTGLWLLREGLDRDDADDERARIVSAASTRGLPMIGIALSVSLDELAVGFSFGILRLPIVPALVAIALQALALSALGLWLGKRIGAALGERAEMLAGVILILLGIGLAGARLLGVQGVP